MFLFNVSSPTESYKYDHTLSLHEPLPIFGRPADRQQHAQRVLRCRRGDDAVEGEAAARLGHGQLGGAQAARLGLAQAVGRSEEHTSELQSLMRISYAVFCLIKKTHNHTKKSMKVHRLDQTNSIPYS